MFINKFGGKGIEDTNDRLQKSSIKRKGIFLHFNVNEGGYDAKNRKIIQLANPGNSTDAANKYYVDRRILSNDKALRDSLNEKIEKCASQCQGNYDKLKRINTVLNLYDTNFNNRIDKVVSDVTGKIVKLEVSGKENTKLLQNFVYPRLQQQKTESDSLNEKLNTISKNIDEINKNIALAKNSISHHDYFISNLSESAATKDAVENLTTALEKDIVNLQSLLEEQINQVKQNLRNKENDIANIRKEFVTQGAVKTIIDKLRADVNDIKENLKLVQIAVIEMGIVAHNEKTHNKVETENHEIN